MATLALLAVLLHLLGEFFPALLGELGEYQTDDTAVVLGVDARGRLTWMAFSMSFSRLLSQGSMTRVRGSGEVMEPTWLMGVS